MADEGQHGNYRNNRQAASYQQQYTPDNVNSISTYSYTDQGTSYYPQNFQQGTGFYQQPYFDPNFYGYSQDEQFYYDPNLNAYNQTSLEGSNGATNYTEYDSFPEQWNNQNQESTQPQSKSYRNNRYRTRRGGQNSSNQNGISSVSDQGTPVSGRGTSESGHGTSNLVDVNSKSERLPSGGEDKQNEATKSSKSKWDNSSLYLHRTNKKTSNYTGYRPQEFGAGLSRGNRGYTEKTARSDIDNNRKVNNSKIKKGDEENDPPSTKSKSTRIKKKETDDNETTDQRSRMIEQLTKGRYECMVCCENMRPDTAVWNCSSCYHLFHLFCIKKWARSSTALVEGGSAEGWRCPACQNITEKVPNSYKCFCGKIRDPVYNRYETPHSCGDVCNRNRKGDCQHPCTLLCHPGACPPCSATVTKSCDCGQINQTVRCGLNIGLKCDNKCGKLLNCGKHTCLVICHSGACQICTQSFKQECYGRHSSREVVCGSNEDQEISYSCSLPCNSILECGNHRCELECHPGDCPPCPLLPDQIKHCPCGRTLITDLTNEIRTSCLATLPTCDKVCKKQLKCGTQDRKHVCKKVCHEGDCPQCEGYSKLRCVCKNIEKSIPCTKAITYNDSNPFFCDKKCTKKRHCGKHKCGEVCCKREEHICESKCNRKLTCGRHKCGQMCHPGNCLPCLEASFDELTCHCGSAMIFPPVACGTRPPECNQVCQKQHDCEHPVRHNCHSEEICPPCTALTEKRCVGGHEIRKNIPCHIKDIICGYPCGRTLPCGKHKCKQTCHKGDCLPEGEDCTQPCDIKREECGHPCGAPCHLDTPCPLVACKTEISVKCACGNKQSKVSCQLGGENTTDYQKVTVESWMNQGSVEIAQIKKGVKRQLDCDAECAKLERNRRMALALEIENPDLTSKLNTTMYPDVIKDFAKKNPEKATQIEKALYDLVINAKQSKYPSRSHSFPSMNRENRQFVHELAVFYGCETQSYDNEPKKNVVATAYKNRCYSPNVGISVFIQRESTPTLAPPTAVSTTRRFGAMTTLGSFNSRDSIKSEAGGKKPEIKTETGSSKAAPVIDYFDFTEG